MPKVSFRYDPPRVYVAGISTPNKFEIERYLQSRNLSWAGVDDATPAALVELGGRICYESFHNPKGRTREEYIQDSILASHHGSVTEHVSLNLIVEGLPRAILMELTRHRQGVAYSWRSTRFVDKWMEFMIPARIQGTPAEYDFIRATGAAVDAYVMAVQSVDPLTDDPTLARKRRREAARNILGGNLTSDGLFTCNIRALRHIIQMRTDAHADFEFRRFAAELFFESEAAAPEFFADADVQVVDELPQVRFKNSERAG